MSRHLNFNKKAIFLAVLGAVSAQGAMAQLTLPPPPPTQQQQEATNSQPPSALSLPALKAEAAQQKPAVSAPVPVPALATPEKSPGTKSAPNGMCQTVVSGPCPEPAPVDVAPIAVDAPAPAVKKPVVKVDKKVVVVKKYVDVKNPEAAEQKFTAPAQDELAVSDRDFNHFIFPSPITQLLFPSGAPVMGSPVYVADNTQVLVQFKRGQDKPFQMIVETESGAVHKMYLKARPINGVTHRIDSKAKPAVADTRNKANQGEAVSAGGADIELLRRIIAGDTPADFEPVDLPGLTRFDKFTAIPLTGYSNGKKRVAIFTLTAVPGQSAIVAPPMFYRQGITAVLLDGDTVNAEVSPQLYVVEDLNDE